MRYAGSPLVRIERALHIGIPPTLAPALSAALLTSLGTAFPRVDFDIVVAGTDPLVEAMLEGTVDVALINQISDERLFCRDLLKEDLVVVGGPHADLSRHRPISFTELASSSLLLPASASGIRAAVENTALRLKLRISCRFATDSLHIGIGLMESGAALGVLPLSACTREIEQGRLRYAPLREPALAQHLALAVSSQLTLPREFMVKLGEVIREETARLIESGAWPALFLARNQWDAYRQ